MLKQKMEFQEITPDGLHVIVTVPDLLPDEDFTVKEPYALLPLLFAVLEVKHHAESRIEEL